MKMSTFTQNFISLYFRYYGIFLRLDFLAIIYSVTKTSRDLNPFVGRPGMMNSPKLDSETPCY